MLRCKEVGVSNRKTGSIVISIILGVLIFFLGHRVFFVSSGIIKQAASYFVYPVLVLQRNLVDPINVWFKSRASLSKLNAIIDDLRSERNTLLAENIMLQAMAVYAQETKELREFNTKYTDMVTYSAQILTRHFSDREHFFLIDVGTNQGITVDMVAIYCNCMIGRVTQVYPWYSKVCLITDRACKVAACCAQTRVSGIHEGTNKEGETILRYVSHLKTVREHDLVISSGEGLVFPQGFALGRISALQSDDLYHHITLKPLIDLRRLRYCAVIAKEKKRAI